VVTCAYPDTPKPRLTTDIKNGTYSAPLYALKS
jgi:hypothetical protein